jgi:DNA-binding CsgD family transcriptional regulator
MTNGGRRPSRLRGPPSGLRGRRRECEALDGLVDGVRAGRSRVLLLCGEAGVGKTALLDHAAGYASGCRVARAAGVQSEMELAFAGLHQLCAPMLDRLDRLPGPQRTALRTAFGLSRGAPPDRFLVGLAVLNLLSDVAGERPLLCLVDDEQWLDRASAQVLGFVARRLSAESIGLVVAARTPSQDLAGVPELTVDGLGDADARAVLDAALPGRLDVEVRDRIVAETGGNPLALLELPRGMTSTELAGGFAVPDAVPLSASVEASFGRRLAALPGETRTLLLLAAADQVGDPVLVWRAAERLGIPAKAATPAVQAGLLEFGVRVRFPHPLVRSAAYRSASLAERQDAHRALAEATDAGLDPDRRAWHRAQAAPGPDEEVAGELERSAARAQARGGLAAAAAFLERAAMLTPEPADRARRLLAAARAKRAAGALDAALALLVAVEAGPPDPVRTAELEHLRGLVTFVQRGAADGARLLLHAATGLAALDAALARELHLEALGAAMWSDDMGGPGSLRAAAEAARAAPPAPRPARAVDVLLDAFAVRLTEGYPAAAPLLARAVALGPAPDGEVDRWRWLATGRAGAIAAVEQWDAESWHTVATVQTRLARETGAPVHLQYALNTLAVSHLLAGELAAADLLVEEDRLIAEVTGNPPARYAATMLAAWRGREPAASEQIAATVRAATGLGLGRLVLWAESASAVLHSGLGRHDAARDAAFRAFDRDQLGLGPFVVPELAEAGFRTGDLTLVAAALDWLDQRAEATASEWALGIRARVRALLEGGVAAESCYRESIDRLGRTRLRAQLARGHLLYGEWLRRERRRIDAREHLRTAYDMFSAMGIEAFAERAGRELAATGETARKRSVATRGELTAQEAVIARLARDGLSNPEIGSKLFISARTVQYHLHKVFAKLTISSRSQLDRALPDDPPAAEPE